MKILKDSINLRKKNSLNNRNKNSSKKDLKY